MLKPVVGILAAVVTFRVAPYITQLVTLSMIQRQSGYPLAMFGSLTPTNHSSKGYYVL